MNKPTISFYDFIQDRKGLAHLREQLQATVNEHLAPLLRTWVEERSEVDPLTGKPAYALEALEPVLAAGTLPDGFRLVSSVGPTWEATIGLGPSVTVTIGNIVGDVTPTRYVDRYVDIKVTPIAPQRHRIGFERRANVGGYDRSRAERDGDDR